jgi:2-phosphoglycerate kinase
MSGRRHEHRDRGARRPRFLDADKHGDFLSRGTFIIGIDDEERHRSHFAAREDAIASRPATRYMEGFDGIRTLQGYVKSQALAHGVPVIPNHSFDQTIATVIDLVMDKATSQAAEVSVELAASASTTTTTPPAPKEGRSA